MKFKKVYTRDETNNVKGWFFEKNEIEKPLAGLSPEGKNKQYRDERGHIT